MSASFVGQNDRAPHLPSDMVSGGARYPGMRTTTPGLYRAMLLLCPACDVRHPGGMLVEHREGGDGDLYCRCGGFHVGTFAR